MLRKKTTRKEGKERKGKEGRGGEGMGRNGKGREGKGREGLQTYLRSADRFFRSAFDIALVAWWCSIEIAFPLPLVLAFHLVLGKFH